jgi:hypothetical protein
LIDSCCAQISARSDGGAAAERLSDLDPSCAPLSPLSLRLAAGPVSVPELLAGAREPPRLAAMAAA